MPYITPDGLDESVLSRLDDEIRQLKAAKNRWEGLIAKGLIPAGDEGEISLNYIGPINTAVDNIAKVRIALQAKLQECEEGIHRFRTPADKNKYRDKGDK